MHRPVIGNGRKVERVIVVGISIRLSTPRPCDLHIKKVIDFLVLRQDVYVCLMY